MSRRLSREDKAAIERAGLLHRLATENFYAMPLEQLRRVVAAIDEPALTDAEREALESVLRILYSTDCEAEYAVLRSLLARLGGAS